MKCMYCKAAHRGRSYLIDYVCECIDREPQILKKSHMYGCNLNRNQINSLLKKQKEKYAIEIVQKKNGVIIYDKVFESVPSANEMYDTGIDLITLEDPPIDEVSQVVLRLDESNRIHSDFIEGVFDD